MALQFILGSGSTDAVPTITDTVNAALTSPSAEVFYLVPNHIKFESEVRLLQALRQTSGAYAQSRVQTFSLSRLAWYFLKNRPEYQQPVLDSPTNTMLVAKILADHREALPVFAPEVGHTGFAQTLATQLSELLSGGVTGESLSQAASEKPLTDPQGRKWAELAKLLTWYQAAIGQFTTPVGQLQALTARLAEQDLSETTIILNHFNDFTAVEMRLVSTLMQRAKQVVVVLTLPKKPTTVAGSGLYAPAAKVYLRLLDEANANGVKVMLDQKAPARTQSAAFDAVEAYFTGAQAVINPAGLHLAKASTAYEELRHVMLTITQLVHQGARYRDFLVVARRLEPYANIITPLAREFDLPVFIDREQPMANHPLLRFVSALFAVMRSNYGQDDVMSLLHTRLLVPTGVTEAAFEDALATLDNHLTKTAQRGNAWQKPWQYLRMRFDPTKTSEAPEDVQINQLRELVVTQIEALKATFAQASSGKEAATGLYQWLLDAGVVEQLQLRQEADTATVATKTAIAQAWQTFIHLLEQYVTVWGEAPFNQKQMQELLEAGFQSATFTQIPATFDQVTVSETNLTQLPRFKHVFVIGATSTAMPMAAVDDGLLSDHDRTELMTSIDGSFLPLRGGESMLGEPFINYGVMMTANTSLTLSYPENGGDTGKQEPSPYLTGLKDTTQTPITRWSSVTLQTPISAVAGTARSLLTDYLRIYQQASAQQATIGAAWNAVASAVMDQPKWGKLMVNLQTHLPYVNKVGKLNPELALKLYGDKLFVSISKLQSYYKNPYAFFLEHGLKLQPRPEYGLNMMDRGTFLHKVMEDTIKKTVSTKQPLKDLTEAQLRQLVEQTVDAILAENDPRYDVLTSSNLMAYQRRAMVDFLFDSLNAIAAQMRTSSFVPFETEVTFGSSTAYPPLTLTTPKQNSVMVRGRIDRIDRGPVTGADPVPLMVLDYKSGALDFNADEAHFGTAMQLLTYLDALTHADLGFGQAPLMVGAFYLQLHRVTLTYPLKDDPAAALQKAYQLTGLLVLPDDDDQARELLTQVDANLEEPGTNSSTIHAGLKKNGEFYQYMFNKATVRTSELRLLQEWNRRKIAEAADAILGGNIDLAPVQRRHEATTITNSPYASVMAFDPTTGNRYNRMPTMDLKTVIATIKAALGEQKKQGDQL